MIPTAETKNPPAQHNAATTPALRGPARSSQPPSSAAEEPSTTKNSVYMIVRSPTCQSQVVVVSRPSIDISAGQAILFVTPTARESGSQNTEKPYAIPMHRWIASAAGGTSQRLKPGPATMRSRSNKPGVAPPMPAVVAEFIFYVPPKRLWITLLRLLATDIGITRSGIAQLRIAAAARQ